MSCVHCDQDKLLDLYEARIEALEKENERLTAILRGEHRGDCTQEAFTCQLCNAYNEGYDDAMAKRLSSSEA